jgi:hypothetical protein
VVDLPEEGVERLVYVGELPLKGDALEIGFGEAYPIGPHHRQVGVGFGHGCHSCWIE